MKFHVSEDCIGCGLCASTCPEVFRINEDGVSEAQKSDVAPEYERAALEARDNCPVSAIEEEEP